MHTLNMRVFFSLCLVATLLAAGTANAATIIVTSNADSGAGTLRAAITSANATVGSDTITFAIGTGFQTITLATALPTITQPVVIDATTQPGWLGNPLIEINGAAVTGTGLTINAGSSTVKGLVINRFQGAGGHGIVLASGSNTIQNCYIGTNTAGTAALANGGYGIYVQGSGNAIGGLLPENGNVISGNASYGIMVFGAAIMGGTIRGNHIGTNALGTAAVANGSSGVRLSGPSSITVGGTVLGARNIISGNAGSGITIDGNGGGNMVYGNYIGTNYNGTSALPNTGNGISIASPNVLIGNTTAGSGNVISGNGSVGIFVTTSAPASGNGASIAGNFIGTNAAGTAAVANQSNGIRAIGVTGLTVGSTSASGRNVISGNKSNGVSVEGAGSSSAKIIGNYIGVAANGTTAIANGGSGINVSAAPGVMIGDAIAGSANVISGNTYDGIDISTASATLIKGNFIGTNASGNASVPNGGSGIRDVSGSGTVVGGTTAAERNVISGNTTSGIDADATSQSIVIQGNYIGTAASGTAALPNGGGLRLYGANAMVGGTSAGARNLISGNTSGGVAIGGNTISVKGNYIGTTATGAAALPNGSSGIRLTGGTGAQIGGTTAGERNVISGNAGAGIAIDGTASGCSVQGNYIGVDTTGAVAIPNGSGVSIGGSSNTIGGTLGGSGNVISANTSTNIVLSGASATGNVIQGNLIGTNAAGTATFATGTGIRVITANGNTIGGTTAAARNVISGNYRGITLEYGSTGNVVQGNYIGTNAAGTAALPNVEEGIDIGAPGNTIGGDVAGAGNVISGQTNYGIRIGGSESIGTKVYGNIIGTRPDGTTPLPNQIGVLVYNGFSAEVGGSGAGQGNVIAANTYEGIRVQTGYGNSFLRNSMFGNAVLGIDLEPNDVTLNDPQDPDIGANKQQNYPLLSSAIASGGNTTIVGTLNSTPSTDYRVEFFGSPTCSVSGMGEGKTFLGFATVTTDASGNGTINAVLPVGAPGAYVTATATDPVAGTSEFSPCAAVGGPNPGQFQFSKTYFVYPEYGGIAKAIVTRSGGMSGAVTVHYATTNGTAVAPGDYTSTSGDLAFAANEVAKTISVPLVVDALVEAQETFTLTLSAPTGGATLGAQTTATMYINDTDTSFPGVSVSDVTITEGNAGTKNATFTMTISQHTATVTVGWGTSDGTATAGSDYVAVVGGSTVFAPGELSKQVNVVVNGDVTVEPDEDFFVIVNSILPNGFVDKGIGEGIITNDDGLVLRGDANDDGVISVADVMYLINDLFAGGAAPASTCRGDANNDGVITAADVAFLLNYLFAGGAAPMPATC